MTLNEYQEKAMQTCMPSSNNFAYMMLNLQAEMGEFSGKVAKGIRKGLLQIGSDWDDGKAPANSLCKTDSCSADYIGDNELEKEAGDILWQLSGLCRVMGWSLEDVAQMNLDKLSARQKAGTIDGNGDGISGKERTK